MICVGRVAQIIEPLRHVSTLPVIFRIPFGTTNIPRRWTRTTKRMRHEMCTVLVALCGKSVHSKRSSKMTPPQYHIRPLASSTTLFLRIILLQYQQFRPPKWSLVKWCLSQNYARTSYSSIRVTCPQHRWCNEIKEYVVSVMLISALNSKVTCE